MNDRIKDLAKQAGIQLPEDSVYNGHIYRNSLERFAQLIIKESISVMQQHDYHGEWLGEKLKEHFGVEE